MKNLSLTFCLGIAALFGGVSVSWGNNLETCLSGKYTSLCNKSLLTTDQLTQVQNAEKFIDKKQVSSAIYSSSSNMSYLNVGGGDVINLTTGDYIMDFGGGDKMNLSTGEYLMNMGEGDMMNLTTGDYMMDMGGGDKMNLGTGEYLMSIGGGDMMNLSTGELMMSLD